MQDVALAISAIGGDSLAERGIDDISNLQSYVPNLHVGQEQDGFKISLRGIGIQPDDIFYTSSKAHGIAPGKNFTEAIRSTLDEATVVVALISPNFYASAFCMCELGASWIIARDNFIPLLVPPASYGDMKAVLEGVQALKLKDDEDLDVLRDDLTKRLKLEPRKTPHWTKKKNRFLEQLTEALEDTKPPPLVDRKALERALKEKTEYEETLHKMGALMRAIDHAEESSSA